MAVKEVDVNVRISIQMKKGIGRALHQMKLDGPKDCNTEADILRVFIEHGLREFGIGKLSVTKDDRPSSPRDLTAALKKKYLKSPVSSKTIS